MVAAAAVQVLRQPRQARALLDPDRLKLLEMLAEPGSAAGLARQLGMARQLVNYHMRGLEREGLLEFVEERRKGNCVERLVRATARSYLISPEALGKLGEDPATTRDRFSLAYLVSTAARAIRDLAVLRSRAARAGKRLATLTLEAQVRFASPADRNAFAEELATEFARLAAKYHNEKVPGGRLFRFFAGVYPAITKHEDDARDAVRME